mmetsp:Transcript_63631/g.143536  ORF Transcript_63631/g.143536 Transcript_63631/m.143536 type:complete len:261 (+) Transcript_63631:147-929(+)
MWRSLLALLLIAGSAAFNLVPSRTGSRASARLFAKKRLKRKRKDADEVAPAPGAGAPEKKTGPGVEYGEGQAEYDPQVDRLVRTRKNRSKGGRNELGGLDLDAFIVEEPLSSSGDLPDLENRVGTERKPKAAAAAGPGQSKEEDGPKIKEVVEMLGKALNPPAENPDRFSNDLFDKGPGLLFKRLIYALGVGLVFWELFLSSPFFDRKAPQISIQEMVQGVAPGYEGNGPGAQAADDAPPAPPAVGSSEVFDREVFETTE